MQQRALHITLLVILALQALLLSWFAYIDTELAWDEAAYLGNARDLAFGSEFTEGIRPPLLSVLVAGLWVFTGESIWAARALAIVVSLAATAVFWLVAKGFLEEKPCWQQGFLHSRL